MVGLHLTSEVMSQIITHCECDCCAEYMTILPIIVELRTINWHMYSLVRAFLTF